MLIKVEQQLVVAYLSLADGWLKLTEQQSLQPVGISLSLHAVIIVCFYHYAKIQ